MTIAEASLTTVDEAAAALVRVAEGRTHDIDFMMLGQGIDNDDLFHAAMRLRGEQLAHAIARMANTIDTLQTVRKLVATFCRAARRAKFRDFFCSARSQYGKFGQRLVCREVFARSAIFSCNRSCAIAI